MKVDGNKSSEYSSKNTAKKDQKKAEGQDWDEIEVIDVPLTDRANAMSVENGTAGNVCALNVSEHSQVNLFVRLQHIKGAGIPLRNSSLWHMTRFRTSIHMYHHYYSCGTLPVTFHNGMSADDVASSSTGGIKAGRQTLNNGVRLMLLKVHYCLALML